MASGIASRLRNAVKGRVRRWSGVAELDANTRSAFELHQEELFSLRAGLDETKRDLAGRLAELEAQARIPAVMETVRRVRLGSEPLISVILPTRDRAALLRPAIDSVLAQTYSNWELVVVDDGSEDETAALLDELDDPRVRALRLEGSGVTGARNAGLDAARGELIAYLDDDNLMHPGWLRTVAWAFETHPDAEVVYGAFIIDDPERVDGSGAGALAKLVFRPFDRERLPGENPADMSAISHRAGLPEARFDESLSMYGDWELLARLVRERDPFAVPAIAAFYGTDAAGRLSARPSDPNEHAAVLRACAG
jgi:hypothetical protein